MTAVLERNLQALGAGDPALASLLTRASPAAGLRFLASAAGLPVPARLREGRPLPYHSLVDPAREARRLAALEPASGYAVVLGLGGGYHLAALLGRPSLTRLLVVERDAGLVRAVLERIDLHEALLDSRTRLLVGVEPPGVKSAVLSDYLPALHGGLETHPLRAAFEEHPDYYREVTRGIQEAAALAGDDFAVQARLGRRWFVNTIANLAAAARCTVSLRPVERAVVTGAGPSLEAQVPRLVSLREKAFLIASDASLPALLGYGLTPDLVVSIDCQLASYHHFLQGVPPGVPLALDLASPPVLGRLTPHTLYFAGGHPLSRYVSAHWRSLPVLDTSGGNVAQAAVSLAVSLGAREVFLAGLDFSYPAGKAYSRGTFLYKVAGAAESRLQTVESWFLAFLLEGRGRGQARYTSRPLTAYRRRLEAYARTVPARLTALPGAMVELDLPERPAPASVGAVLAAGAPTGSWDRFLESYAAGLERLPEPTPPAFSYYQSLQGPQRALWTTLLPAAAALRERLPPGEREAHRLLAHVREWSLERIRRRLSS